MDNKKFGEHKPLRAAIFIHSENLIHFKMSYDENLGKDPGKEVSTVFTSTKSGYEYEVAPF